MDHSLWFVTDTFTVSETYITFSLLNPDEFRFDLIDMLLDIQVLLALFLLRNRQSPGGRYPEQAASRHARESYSALYIVASEHEPRLDRSQKAF
jgi:hypothetical protein